SFGTFFPGTRPRRYSRTKAVYNPEGRHPARSASQPRELAAAIARAAPLILADAQGYFADQNVTVSLRKYAGWTGRYSR
ncbi:MAG: hypothetical protein ACFNPV_10085, partial [Corynebacterium matruchotii]